MELINQQVINDNKDIYAKIQKELLSAGTEILIATAWFTDDELYQIVAAKVKEGVRVEVIIADNQENERLDFDSLVAAGAAVFKIRNSGYGIMNQKFCVIDRRIALHGSYNWSVNAKKNNQESIISTNHQETINSLIENFNAIKTKIQEQPGEAGNGTVTNIPKTEKPKSFPTQVSANAGTEFEKVLDSMIAAEVGSFDRKFLREQGFDRAKANSGDHQVLHKAFDTVYSVFINNIDVIDDKKRRLQTKIEEHRVKTRDVLTKACELEIEYRERDASLNKANIESRQSNLETQIATSSKDIDEIRDNKVPMIENQNRELDQKIKKAELEFITPKIKWFELIPTCIFNAALLCYLFVFYSSAAYILLFSVADAKEAEAQNMPIAEAQIFNAHAISKAAEKGWVAVLFICLFVFIPLSFAMADRFIKNKLTTIALFWFGIIFLDGAVAYKVTESIYEVNYARGNFNLPWKTSMAFTDTNFYLVFVFGALGLLMFKFALKKLMQLFEDRNPDILAERNQLFIKQLIMEMGSNAEKITILKDEMCVLEKVVIEREAEVKQIQHELSNLPVTLNHELQKKRSQLISDLETIDKIASIYSIHIESDNLPISVDALKDRINVFLEGWNDYLYHEYAIPKATLKTAQAAEIALVWQNEKLQINKIDKRVKFHTHE
ncbi:phospholipase D-like domain-containing protein [Mucilaginibacter sp. PAMB04168]|uniref:phospholipase D-like domain-containing protein n=1 Tax=Mucilaginibacter sp. PAMB04168 TaxID=3138567 RepID=UPI0031F603C6